MVHYALTAVALLLFLYAVRILFVSSKGAGDQKKQRLGCGFAVVAAILWIYVLNHYLGAPASAIRIAVGALLILPAVRALAKPGSASIFAAAVGLALAVVVAGPPLRDLWQEHGLDTRPAEERELADAIAELQALRGELLERRGALEEFKLEVKAELAASGKGFDEIAADPELYPRLQLLGRISEELDQVQQGLAAVEVRLPQLQAALAAARDQGQEAEPTADSELDALLRSLENAPTMDELSLVEQYALEKELEVLYDEEF